MSSGMLLKVTMLNVETRRGLPRGVVGDVGLCANPFSTFWVLLCCLSLRRHLSVMSLGAMEPDRVMIRIELRCHGRLESVPESWETRQPP